MARKKYGNSEVKNKKWIKEGRGSGRNHEYKPWLTVRDLPSDGRSHRVFGHKSKRTHHLFSDLELAVFLLNEWHSQIGEIREQFPLQIDITQRLAKESGIKHPEYSGVDQYMSSDFLVNSSDLNRPKFALQAKYVSAFNDPRTIEKIEIERRYWKEKEVPWFLITERNIPKVVFQNINWLYPAQRDKISEEDILQRVEYYFHYFKTNPTKKIIDICKMLDISYTLNPGDSLFEMRQLLAQRYFVFDIFIPTIKLTGHDIEISDTTLILEEYNVSNK